MSKIYRLKCRIRNEGGDVTRVDIMDDIGAGGWFSEGLTAKDFAAKLSGIKGALDIHINSCGGDCFDGIAITNAIRSHKGDTTTIIDGVAASIASVIFQAGKNRVALKNSMGMIHDAFGLCVGNAAEMTAFAATLDKVSDNIASVYADRSGKTADYWRGEMRQERWYTAEEMVAEGLADEMGEGDAELPAGLDVAAFTSVPGRIAAQLRSLPVAARPKAATHPYDGEHSHSHSAYGASGADGDDMHSHAHDHDNDGDHDHSHGADGTASDHAHGPQGHGSTAEQTCADLGHQCCQGAAATKDLLRGLVRDELASQAPANADGKPMHGDHERWDPDGDGDCDACPEGDTDNSRWATDGTQLQAVPGKPMPDHQDKALTADDIRAICREEFAAFRSAGADESAWDGPAAMLWASGQDNPESAFRSICAGEKTDGEPDTQDHWALPHHKHSGDPPNAHGVSAALGRLNQTQGLKDKGAAEAHLKAHQSAMGSGGTEDHEQTGFSGIDLEQLGKQLGDALKGAIA